MSTTNGQTVRYIAIGGYNGACKCQVLTPDSGEITGYEQFTHAIPISWDLAKISTPPPESSQFLLHSDVHGEHIHSETFVYSSNGGLLIGGIVDDQGHFSDFSII